MPRTKAAAPEKRLTDVELELMSILWTLGGEGASVAEVIAQLPSERTLAYTSVSTIVRILESKGFVASRRQGRGHIYSPVLTRSEYEARAVRDVVNRVFQGVPVAMVRQLIEHVQMTDDDVRELRKLVGRIKDRK